MNAELFLRAWYKWSIYMDHTIHVILYIFAFPIMVGLFLMLERIEESFSLDVSNKGIKTKETWNV